MGYHEGMTRTTVTIDANKLAALRQLAAERGVSVSCLVREAVDEKLANQPLYGPRPRPHLGTFDSGDTGYPPLSELASDFGEIVDAGIDAVRARYKKQAAEAATEASG